MDGFLIGDGGGSGGGIVADMLSSSVPLYVIVETLGTDDVLASMSLHHRLLSGLYR